LDTRATIVNIFDEDVIDCFQNSFAKLHLYCDFGCSHPKTIIELPDMMQRWADQRDKERDFFPSSNNDNGGMRNNDHRHDQSQQDFSRKRNQDDVVAAVEHLRGIPRLAWRSKREKGR